MLRRLACLILAAVFQSTVFSGSAAHATQGRQPPLPTDPTLHYEIDAGHSSILFKVKRNGVSNFFGRFNRFSGTIDLLEKGARASGDVSLAIAIDSLDTGIDARDTKLKNDKELFAFGEFPKALFTSTSVRKVGPNRFGVQGTLTFRGIAQPVHFEAKRLGASIDRDGGGAAGFEAVIRFSRGKFGMTGMAGSIGDEVEVTVSLACAAKAPATVEQGS